MKERKSNFELMRIVSMLFIVTGHTLSLGGIPNNATTMTKLIVYIIYALIVVHVNSFILLSGYFQSKSQFRLRKVINLIALMLFYRVVLYSMSLIAGWEPNQGIYMTIYNMLPLSNFSYWFLNVYIVLYLLSPFLNKMIKSLNMKTYTALLIILFLTLSVATRLTLNTFISTSGGYSLIHFIFIYLIGAYIREYGEKIKIKLFKKEFTIKSHAISFLFIYLFLAALKFTINFLGYRITGTSGIRLVLHDSLSYSFKNLIYNDPLVILQSIAYFLFFYRISIKSKIITKISKATNEVYLLHMHKSLRGVLYTSLGLKATHYTVRSFPMAFVVVLIIFTSGVIIYYFRTSIIELIKKISFVKKLSEKYYKKTVYIDNIMNSN